MQYGYRYDLENFKRLEQYASPMPQITFTAPEEIDPTLWHRIENQGSMGSCQGHALSSVCEYCYYIATGSIIQFSPMWCYLGSQKIDGLLGRDNGSTIDGGRRLAEEGGVCRLEVFPYPNPVHYSTNIPSGAAADAAKYKIRHHVICRSYDDVFQFLASGMGGVELGITWNGSCQPNSQGRIETYNGGGGGGHAICFLGYSKDVRDSQGRKYLWLANSWDKNWGKNGFALVAPRAVEQMFQSQYTVMIGMSEMIDLKPREIDFASAFYPRRKSSLA